MIEYFEKQYPGGYLVKPETSSKPHLVSFFLLFIKEAYDFSAPSSHVSDRYLFCAMEKTKKATIREMLDWDIIWDFVSYDLWNSFKPWVRLNNDLQLHLAFWTAHI